ncbi:DUF2937 family protein [Thalassotalea sp. HSM 43]|uniref:DUF2937 family protein n=1 Tax=Thalassotalea sp. HSM 43 TaxID=2552945 RepID=UPI001080447A|nr:DUF2937 family protein [Thalassotalea sp. HSM 43]QBY05839.1 DUF2937 family protein [Thalassotalea sp. HSM 43]
MLTFFARLIDKLVFAIAGVTAMQLPALMQQYQQRLSGHLSEAQYQLGKYQQIADEHYQGNIASLIEQYRNNTDPGINAAGDLVYQLVDRISVFSTKLQHLQTGDYIQQVYYFVSEIEHSIFTATLQDFQPSIPLESSAIATGVIGAVLISSLLHIILNALQLPFKRYA